MENEKLEKCLKQAKEWYKSNDEILRSISLKLFDESELVDNKKEEELPSTWEGFCETHDIQECERVIDADGYIDCISCVKKRDDEIDASFLPNRQYAEAFLAWMKLIQLRDCYRQGWKPNWHDEEDKYVISFDNGELTIGCMMGGSEILSFSTEELRDALYDNFKDLIETASYLYE